MLKSNVATIINIFFSSIVDCFQDGGNVELREFGSFSIKSCNFMVDKAASSHNQYLRIYFRSSKKLSAQINNLFKLK
ncbi:HU family DNA-binding protein [Candidatus Mesenet endosymbiont of Phosphuga atrata]|uniref:HU family DNA-binding protein n=1 Tax=Candidatus Mesenet endosymbiont of Phosphuga atrata TaxID=3066221 RepID=UPI0030CB6D77